MYDSNPTRNLVDERTRNQRTEIVSRLHGTGFNLIPMNGKKPCIKWKPHQTQRVTSEEIKEWMRGRFPARDGKTFWKPEILNFALLTGAVPWSADNPGTVVLDPDDDEAEELVRQYCPPTPMIQRTGSGGVHWVYRKPDVERVSNRQKTVIGGQVFNLDVRGDGGYIMAPGSIHPETMKLYEEQTPWTLELLMECPIYDPSWIPHEGTNKRTTVLVSSPVVDHDHDQVTAGVGMPVSTREEMARRYLRSVPGT